MFLSFCACKANTFAHICASRLGIVLDFRDIMQEVTAGTRSRILIHFK